MNFASILDSALLQGLSWGLATFGLIISLRVFRFPDLTVDGSFGLGGAICAILLTHGVVPWVATLVAFTGGLAAGLATGVLHVHAKIGKLLSGILMMTALYSINFRIMGNKSNLSLLDTNTMLSSIEIIDIKRYLPLINFHLATYGFFLLFWLVICALFFLVFHSEWGIKARLAGYDKHRADGFGFNSGNYIIKGLMFSNGLVALSGALVCQSQGFSDYNMGTGLVIIALASVLIGEQFINLILPKKYFPEKMNSISLLLAPFWGTFLYYFLIGLLLRMSSKNMLPIINLQPTDLKLITAISVVTMIWLLPVNKSIQTIREETI